LLTTATQGADAVSRSLHPAAQQADVQRPQELGIDLAEVGLRLLPGSGAGFPTTTNGCVHT
jgi:hypothetical protein